MNLISAVGNWARRHPLPLFLIGTGGFLLVLNQWLWPTPDEYLYASVARSIIAGLKGEICLSCFNTEHTYLVSALAAIYQWLFKIGDFDLISVRVPVILFSLGTIVLLWKIAALVVLKPQERSWFLWLLLLVPGYFVLSTRLLLDVPLTFGFALLIYLMATKAKPIWIGLALALILVIKDYGLYLSAPIVLAGILLDVLAIPQLKIGPKILRMAGTVFVTFLPSALVIIVLMASDILPFPRLLEAGLIQYFGDLYYAFAKLVLTVFEKSVETIKSLAPAPPDVPILFNKRASDVTLPGYPPIAIFASPLEPEAAQGGFWHKLWLIYQYNFSDQDVMVFTLPFFLTGLIERFKIVWSARKRWQDYRPDILLMLLVTIFAYLNWHEALNIHGFRVTVPIVIGLVYFGYFGARAVLIENNRPAHQLFAWSFLGSLLLYAAFVSQIQGYGSLISDDGLIAILLRYKLAIFMVIFSLSGLYLLSYWRLTFPAKGAVLVGLLLILFALKFLPMYLEARVATNFYGFDYGLAKLAPLAEKYHLERTNVAMNVNQYVMRYYLHQLELPTTDTFPQMRRFRIEYPSYYAWLRSPGDFNLEFIRQYEPRFILLVNQGKGGRQLEQFDQFISAYQGYIKLIKEESSTSGYLQWRLYAFDRDGYFRDVAPAG